MQNILRQLNFQVNCDHSHSIKSSGDQSFRKFKQSVQNKNACMFSCFINLKRLLNSKNMLESGIGVGQGIIIGLVDLEKE